MTGPRLALTCLLVMLIAQWGLLRSRLAPVPAFLTLVAWQCLCTNCKLGDANRRQLALRLQGILERRLLGRTVELPQAQLARDGHADQGGCQQNNTAGRHRGHRSG